MIKFTFTEKDTEYSGQWMSFYPKRDIGGFCLRFSPWNYFDPRPQIVTNVSSLLTISLFILMLSLGMDWWTLLLFPALFFSWGQLFFQLPWDSKNGNTAEYPDWGINVYSVDGEFPNHFWIRLGYKSKTIEMPWACKWVRTSLLLKDGTWADETRKKREEFWDDKWNDLKFVETHPYTYTLKNGEIQNRTATITVQEREWRRYYTTFTSLFNRTRRVIEIQFNDEVGERSGSWKGGCTGCSYTLNKGETPLECLRRMEKERKF